MWTVDELRAWCLPQNMLLPEELPRLGELLELYRDQLTVVAGGSRRPTATQRLAARRRTVVLWDADRETFGVRDAAIRRRQQETSAGRRQELYADSEVRVRNTRLALTEIDEWDRLARVAAGLMESEAIPERSSG